MDYSTSQLVKQAIASFEKIADAAIKAAEAADRWVEAYIEEKK